MLDNSEETPKISDLLRVIEYHYFLSQDSLNSNYIQIGVIKPMKEKKIVIWAFTAMHALDAASGHQHVKINLVNGQQTWVRSLDTYKLQVNVGQADNWGL